MTSHRCHGCGRPTGDRHHYCWRCRRGGLSNVLLDEPDDDVVLSVRRYVCNCPTPRPRFIPIFGGYECARCGHPIVDDAASDG